jgi:DNA-binding transcriptional MerR regulator
MARQQKKVRGLQGFQEALLLAQELKDRRYTVPQLRRVTGMSARQVRHWSEIGMLVPCFRNTKAKGSQPVAYYSVSDVVRALIIREMTRRGLSLAQVRRVENFLESRKLRLTDSAKYLVTDGETAYYAENAGRVVDILKRQNQMLLIPVWEHMVSLRGKLKRVA